MTKTIFFYLDAVGYKFIRDMPFINHLGKQGSLTKAEVEPLHQMEFCIFTSQPQKNLNYWTWYYLDSKNSPYKWVKYLPKIFETPLLKKTINHVTVFKEYLKGNTHMTPIGNIPLSILKKLSLTSKKSFIDKYPVEVPTLFDVLRKEGVGYYCYEWPIYSDEKKTGLKVIKKKDENFLKEVLKNKEKEFLFVHLTVFDAILHRKGSKNKAIKRYLKKLDNLIEKFCKSLLNEDKDLNIVIASDHGMVDIKEKINVDNLFEDLDLDYLLESTIIRAWGNKDYLKILKSRLKGKKGKIYTYKNKESCPVKFDRKYTGDLIFIANPGYEIFPDFFNKKGAKAMHGYDQTEKLDAFFICNKKIINKKRISVIDICPIILKLLNIEKPKSWKGKNY
ncbi:hypothetical protein GF386_00455 [Candidatus Pacearchaeota archaeon]|nr:hypothetical protein [Candidatus Pacearchaeota archaeon]